MRSSTVAHANLNIFPLHSNRRHSGQTENFPSTARQCFAKFSAELLFFSSQEKFLIPGTFNWIKWSEQRVQRRRKMSLIETDNVYLFIPNLIGEPFQRNFKIAYLDSCFPSHPRICEDSFSRCFVLLHADKLCHLELVLHRQRPARCPWWTCSEEV